MYEQNFNVNRGLQVSPVGPVQWEPRGPAGPERRRATHHGRRVERRLEPHDPRGGATQEPGGADLRGGRHQQNQRDWTQSYSLRSRHGSLL